MLRGIWPFNFRPAPDRAMGQGVDYMALVGYAPGGIPLDDVAGPGWLTLGQYRAFQPPQVYQRQTLPNLATSNVLTGQLIQQPLISGGG